MRVHWGAGEIAGPRHEYRESLILGLIRYGLKRGSVVLDAGCGSGSLLFKMADIGYRVHGIEQSKEYVELLRKRVKASGAMNMVHVRQGNVLEIPYPDRSFDAIVSGEVLEHVLDDTRAILEFYRVLKPGGVCIVSVPASPSLWDLTDDWAGHLRRYTREGLVSLFEKKGFVVEDVRFWGFPFVRIYHRWFYLPYVRRRAYKEGSMDAIRPPDVIEHRWAAKILSLLFRFDSLFSWTPFGIGLILKARKPGSVVDIKVSVKLGAIGCPS